MDLRIQGLSRRAAWIAGWVLLVSCIALAGYVIIWPGTTVLGIDVGGLTASSAKAMLSERLAWDSKQVLLRGNGKEVNMLLGAELGVTPDLDATVKACFRPIWRALRDKQKPLFLLVDEDMISSCLTSLTSLFELPVRDARYRIDAGDRVVVVPHVTGKVLDTASLREMFPASGYCEAVPEAIDVKFVDIAPGVRTEELEVFLPLEVISSYSTFYAVTNADRAHNITLAASNLSEMTLGPGEVFSFNLSVGPRTPERGYRKAPVIVGESLQDDYGGGVCQVSTTVYVAMLKAGFTVTERYCHGLPVNYVPLGLDATVAWDYLDLKMTNPGPAPCLLRTTAEWGTLTVDVFGKRVEGLSVEVESKVVKEYPASPVQLEETPATPKLRPGYLVETVRRYIKNGVIELVERLNTSSYPPEKPSQ